MSVTPIKPTAEQQNWLAGVLGAQLWAELCAKPEFREALHSSMGTARMIALRYLATRGSGQPAWMGR